MQGNGLSWTRDFVFTSNTFALPALSYFWPWRLFSTGSAKCYVHRTSQIRKLSLKELHEEKTPCLVNTLRRDAATDVQCTLFFDGWRLLPTTMLLVICCYFSGFPFNASFVLCACHRTMSCDDPLKHLGDSSSFCVVLLWRLKMSSFYLFQLWVHCWAFLCLHQIKRFLFCSADLKKSSEIVNCEGKAARDRLYEATGQYRELKKLLVFIVTMTFMDPAFPTSCSLTWHLCYDI